MATEPPAPFNRPKLTGFVYFSDIPEAVAENASKKPIEGRWPMLNSRTGKSATYWRRLGNWRDDIERFEDCLASGVYPAAGSDITDGSLFWMPPASWRRPVALRGVTARPVRAALMGKAIEVRNDGHLIVCYPMLSLHHLSLMFGADFHDHPGNADTRRPAPLPPEFVLDQIRELELPAESEPAERASPPPAKPRGEGERRALHDWKAFLIEVVWWAAKNSLHPEDHPNLRRHMLKWCKEYYDTPPDESAVDKMLKEVIERMTGKT